MSTPMPATSERPQHRFLGQAETRRFLRDYVRKRVGESDVDDVVQTVLVEALGSERAPEDEAELRKWLIGVARHKIADNHRRGGREQPAELPDIETAPAPVEERELARWAEEQATSNKEAAKTLQWMAREGEGDKLEHIAEEEQLPAARVRQRVSRMRRFMKERWLAELAAVAALATVAFLIWRALRQPPVEIARDPNVPPTQESATRPPPVAPRVAEAGERRKKALESCERGEHRACLDGLDQAKELDPAGDATKEVQEARQAAEDALRDEREKDRRPDDDGAKTPVPEPSSVVPPPKPTATAPTPKNAAPFEKKAPPSKPGPQTPSKGSSLDSDGPAVGEVMSPPSPQKGGTGSPLSSEPGAGSGSGVTGSVPTKGSKK